MDKTFTCASARAGYTLSHWRVIPVCEMRLNGVWRRRPVRIVCKVLFLTVLDKFDLVAFRRVNEGNSTAVRRMWSV
jgi:hypothetical protein